MCLSWFDFENGEREVGGRSGMSANLWKDLAANARETD
jgi:hypothetical protein